MTRKVVFDDLNALVQLCGQNDRTIKIVEKSVGVEIFPKGNELTIEGKSENNVTDAMKALDLIYTEAKKGKYLEKKDIQYLVNQVLNIDNFDTDTLERSSIIVSKTGKIIKTRTNNQFKYLENMRKSDVCFSIGPAGTGKTYLAVAMGIYSILNGDKKRLILTRPVVEAGENLGFLPGDLQQKVNPYLRPLYDAILDMIGYDEYAKLKEREVIEVAPLAYMRGRTLNNAFIILDEAQNTTVAQMKMFLTRMGETSKIVVTGDVTQVDLPKKNLSGLLFAKNVLSHIREISFNYFHKIDVVRHPLVKKIIEAFEKNE